VLFKQVQRSPTIQKLKDNIHFFEEYCKEKQLDKVLEVFRTSWEADDWIVGFVDVFRGGLAREGIQNTNNYSESAIRVVEDEVHSFNNRRAGIENLVVRLAMVSLPRSEKIITSSSVVRYTKAEKAVLKRFDSAKLVSIENTSDDTYNTFCPQIKLLSIRLEPNHITIVIACSFSFKERFANI